MTIVIAALALFYSWRYSRTEIDPDWAMFNLWGFTGAVYGRDFLDCKMPLIHLWYLAIAKVVGRNVARVKFAHHVLISLPGVIVGGWAGLVYVVFINSGALLAFHGNVGQPAAALIFLAMWLDQPVISALLAVLSVGFEPKLAPVSFLLSVVSGWGLQFFLAAALAGTAGVSLKWIKPEWWGRLWEANITITQRMTMLRRKMLQAKDLVIFPWYTQRGFVYALPWVTLGIVAAPDWVYWLPVLAYVALMFVGIVIRPNHLLVLAPWVALAGMPPVTAIALVAADWLSSGLYLGDLWIRFYNGLHRPNIEARTAGEYLLEKPGRLWVNSYHSAVYVYAQKPPVYGLAEQIEIRESAPERREEWRRQFKGDAPEWVVNGPEPGWTFTGKAYEERARSQSGEFVVYRKQLANR